VASDGSIFVGIGDYGGGTIASLPDWNGGKIFRIFPDGIVQQFARGFRNPFDVSWDAAQQRLIVPDNGGAVDDEINIVHQGDFCGWPFTMGNGPPIPGAVPPVYVFPMIVAPTGITVLSGRNSILRNGYLLGAFVTKALYYIPDIDRPNPVAILEREVGFIIDVVEGPTGDIYFTSGNAIYKLIPPLRGDCNADGRVDAADYSALQQAIAGGPLRTFESRQSWGCDVNGDGLIDERDLAELVSLIPRGRAVRAPGTGGH
jgi:glucose/arabinose dehydrogenase